MRPVATAVVGLAVVLAATPATAQRGGHGGGHRGGGGHYSGGGHGSGGAHYGGGRHGGGGHYGGGHWRGGPYGGRYGYWGGYWGGGGGWYGWPYVVSGFAAGLGWSYYDRSYPATEYVYVDPEPRLPPAPDGVYRYDPACGSYFWDNARRTWIWTPCGSEAPHAPEAPVAPQAPAPR